MDRRKATFLFLMTGRMRASTDCRRMILHAHSIRYAIANGFKEYDFSQGNESYKYSFGVKGATYPMRPIATKNGSTSAQA